MIALTSRLNERDETIIQLQEELDAYDRIHRETEQVIEAKTLRIMQLESFISEKCGADVPPSQFNDEHNIGTINQLDSRIFSPHQDYSQGNKLYNAEEKMSELNQIIENQRLENEKLQMQLQEGGDQFTRDQVDSIVQHELQNKMAEGEGAQSVQEKQAFYLMTGDVQSKFGIVYLLDLVQQSMGELQRMEGDPYNATNNIAVCLNQVNKLVGSM
jgi:hypothetical protein